MMNAPVPSRFARLVRPFLALAAIAAIPALASACRNDDPKPPPQPYPNYNQGGPGYYGQPQGNPLGLPCASDGGQCGGHRCNLGSGRCAFPCQGNAECLPGWSCAAGVCVLGVPGVPGMQGGGMPMMPQ